jgi:hypothetical protein
MNKKVKSLENEWRQCFENVTLMRKREQGVAGKGTHR